MELLAVGGEARHASLILHGHLELCDVVAQVVRGDGVDVVKEHDQVGFVLCFQGCFDVAFDVLDDCVPIRSRGAVVSAIDIPEDMSQIFGLEGVENLLLGLCIA